jgi:hypothetical protein
VALAGVDVNLSIDVFTVSVDKAFALETVVIYELENEDSRARLRSAVNAGLSLSVLTDRMAGWKWLTPASAFPAPQHGVNAHVLRAHSSA